MQAYQTKTKKFPSNNYAKTRKYALTFFNQIKRKTKRKPYIRSVYFKKQKIFFDYFWQHLFDKHPPERTRKLQYFEAAIEVIKSSRHEPLILQSPSVAHETLYRFAGMTKNRSRFYVQIKEDKRSGKKYFMSCFPVRRNKSK